MKRNLNSTLIKLSLTTSLSLGMVISIPAVFSAPPSNEAPKQHKIPDHLIDKIALILISHALTYDIDKLSVDSSLDKSNTPPLKGIDQVKAKIAKAVELNQPILLNLVGFPYKSTNASRKVLKPQLDYAERHSLEYLNAMLDEIANIYPPGAKITIFTDGTAFCDMEGIGDEVIALYEQQLKQVAKDLTHIQITTLADLLPGKTPQEMRDHIESFAPDQAEFQAKLETDPHLKDEVNVLTQRMTLELDHPEGHDYTATHPVRDIATKLTQRSLQYSAFLKSYRPAEAIRLSVHYQPDVSTKMGIGLSFQSHITPWHGVFIQNQDGSAEIRHLEDVDTENYTHTTRVVNGISLSLLLWRRR